MANELNFTIPVSELATAIAEQLKPYLLAQQPKPEPVPQAKCTRHEKRPPKNLTFHSLL